jgi:hypothetical protein
MIEATSATQIRKKLIPEIIDQYTEDLQNGADFPAIDVFREKGSARNILADGFHRHRAHINAGIEEIDCNVHEGGMQEALIHAAGSNFNHGMRRTNADKRHAVEMCLTDPEISLRSSQEIADICRVTKRTVNKIKHEKMSAEEPESGNGSHPPEPKEPTNGDVRPTKPEPTQEEIERDELRTAMALIKAFPYDGPTAVKLDLSKSDAADLEYASTWCAGAVLELRK